MQNFDILVGVATELSAKGQLVWPRVWVDPALGPDIANRMRGIVTKLKGTVVEGPAEASATHRVCNTKPTENPKDGKENKSFARYVDRRWGHLLAPRVRMRACVCACQQGAEQSFSKTPHCWCHRGACIHPWVGA